MSSDDLFYGPYPVSNNWSETERWGSAPPAFVLWGDMQVPNPFYDNEKWKPVEWNGGKGVPNVRPDPKPDPPKPPGPGDFWSTQELSVNSRARDVLQVEFSGYRLINHVSFKVSRFPHDVRAEYWDPKTQDWLPLREQTAPIEPIDHAYSIVAQRAKWEGQPLSHSVLDSHPRTVWSASGTVWGSEHPQHRGPHHWVPVSWRCVPVYTRAIRLILVRPGPTVDRHPPVDVHGNPAPYSLAVRKFEVGYRVANREDVPESFKKNLRDAVTSHDLLGRRISYGLKEYPASSALNDVDGLHWRSEPQPFNYAVVNYHLDLREGSGEGQVVDSIYIDPLTTGPSMSIYYTNEDPDSDFEADDSPMSYPIGRALGYPPVADAEDGGIEPTVLDFSAVEPGNLQFDNAYLQWDPARAWWGGVSLRLDTDEGDHPILSWGGHTLRLNGRAVEFVTADGQVVSAPFPATAQVGEDLNIALVHRPRVPGHAASEHDGYWADESTLSLVVGTPFDHATTTRSITPETFLGRPDILYVGTYSTTSTEPSNIALRGLFIQVDTLPSRAVVEGAVELPDLLLLKDLASHLRLTDNSVLRIHPSFWDEDNPTAARGGPGDRYEDVAWTPIPRDYVLRQGFAKFPPVKAKHLKLEFTNLVAMNVENTVTITRPVKVFPPPLVERQATYWMPFPPPRDYPSGLSFMLSLYTATGGTELQDAYRNKPPGMQAFLEMTTVGNYEDAVVRLRMIERNQVRQPSHTEAYVPTDPSTHAYLTKMGWVWGFAPWHTGGPVPRWDRCEPHEYEEIEVVHETKTAFQVGLKFVQPYRRDYLTDDDADVYVETFDDDKHISDLDNVEWQDGGYSAVSNRASITSKVFPSTREVRGVQFASIQSENVALLPDDGFVAQDLLENWTPYGDASLERIALQGVRVVRGALPESGGAGGISSGAVYPSPAGRIYGAVRVSAGDVAGGPVRLEIVALSTGTVLAAQERTLRSGEDAVLVVGYESGSASAANTYGDIEVMTYGDAEVGSVGEDSGVWQPGSYGDLESDQVHGPVFIRFFQTGPSQDDFLVERLSLFDAPVVWEFSVNGGQTWHDAMGTRNSANSVLTFPEPGKELMWRASIYHIDAEVSHLEVRPWYNSMLSGVGDTAMDLSGPNRSAMDDHPDTEWDPMWQQTAHPIPAWWFRRDVASPYGKAPNIVHRGEVITAGTAGE